MMPTAAAPVADGPHREREESKVMGPYSDRIDSVISSRAKSQVQRSRSQIGSLSSTPISELATRVDIPRIRIDTATPLSQNQISRRRTHLRKISVDTITIPLSEERPSPPSSPEESEERYPPRHPVPSMQAAFEESMYEQVSSARGEVGGPGASANWRASTGRSSRLSSRASGLSKLNGKSRYHPLEKLVAQVAFGVYLLHRGLAISENEVVRILQGHVNDMDEFLSLTTWDFDKAKEQIKRKAEHLQFPMDMGPTAATVFETMLKDKSFRTELLENNTNVDHIIRSTVRMSTRALKDIDEGSKAVRNLARFLNSLHDGWKSKNLVRVYGAMVQNVEQWNRCLVGLQKKGIAIADKLQKLKSVIFEIEKRAGVASRADVKSLLPLTRGPRISSRKSATLASKPLPQTPVMTPVILPLQKSDPSKFDLTGLSENPDDNPGLAPTLEIRTEPVRMDSLKKTRPASNSRGRRGWIEHSSSKNGRGISPVSPISTIPDKTNSGLRRRSTKRSSQLPSPVSPVTDQRRSTLWPNIRQPSRRLTTHRNRPFSFLLEGIRTDEDRITPPYQKAVEPLRIKMKNTPLPVPNPYASRAPNNSIQNHTLPHASSGQPPITIQPYSKSDLLEFLGHGSVDDLKVARANKAPRIQTPEIPTPLHFDFTFDHNNSRRSISPLSMLPPADASATAPMRLPETLSPTQSSPPSEPSASMIEALHPVHPGSHYPIPLSPHTPHRPPSSLSGIDPISATLVSPIVNDQMLYEDPLSLGPLVSSGANDINIQGEPITVRRLHEAEAENRKGGVRRLLYADNGIRRCGKCKLGTKMFGSVKGEVVLDEEERGRQRDRDRIKNEKRFKKEERRLNKDLRVIRARSEEGRAGMERLRRVGNCEVM